MGCKDHHVCEVVCGRDVKLHPKLFVVYNAERRLVETRINMIEPQVVNRNRHAQVIHGVHHLIDIKDPPCREHLIICFHDSLRWNADGYFVLVCKSREVGMQGKAKRKRTSALIVYLIGHAEFSPGERICQGQAAIEGVWGIVRAFSVDVNVCGDADCIWPNNRLRIVPGPIKDQTVNERWVPSWPAYIFERVTLSLIGVAFVTYPIWKWPEDKRPSEVSLCEEFLVSVNQIMLTDTETEQIAAELRSNADKYIA